MGQIELTIAHVPKKINFWVNLNNAIFLTVVCTLSFYKIAQECLMWIMR